MSASVRPDVSSPGVADETSHARVAIITLGCGRNDVDSDQLAGLFASSGHAMVDDPAEADVVLVNTCTFIAPAKQESIDTVLAACDLKDDGNARGVLVVGCMAQRYPQELADSIDEADAVIGFAGYPKLPGLVSDVMAGRPIPRVIVEEADPGSRPTNAPPPVVPTDDGGAVRRALPMMMAPSLEAPPEAPPPTLSPVTPQDELDRIPASGPRFPVRRHDGRPWAYLKIASGCDRVCTFCAIPSFRGRFRSRPTEELAAEATWLADRGVRELVLVSENTTSWGKDLEEDGVRGRALQPRLLERLSAIDGIERLRLMYLQPAELQRPLVEAMAGLPGVASYFDLSLQHVSGPIVQAMARSGDHERFLELVEGIRALDPDAVFRSNFILGFPGESEQDVALLEQFLRDARLDWVGLFTFSQEDGTASATMPGQIPEDEARARVEHLASVQERLADDAARAFIGRRLDVLVEEVAQEDGEVFSLGRSYREAPETDGEIELVDADGRHVTVPQGRVISADIVDTVGVDLVARVDPDVA